MKKQADKNIKFIIIVALFVMATGISWSLYFKVYKQDDVVNIHEFPKSFDDWQSKEIKITEDEYAILETRNAFVRKYTKTTGEEVHLFIVYSENNRKVSHPPEICYIGGGVTILKSDYDFVNLLDETYDLKTNKLLLEQGNNKQVSYYWFKVGSDYTANYLKQQALIVLKTLFRKPSNSALIRVSSVINNNDKEEAEANVEGFIQQITPFLKKYLP